MPKHGAIAKMTRTCDYDAYNTHVLIEAFFRANKVDVDARVDALLSSIGTEAYERVFNHFRPNDLATCS